MEETTLPRFIRCHNCNRYVNVEALVEGQYCSSECGQRYARCHTCGRYFPIPIDEETMFCSEACTIQDDTIGDESMQDHLIQGDTYSDETPKGEDQPVVDLEPEEMTGDLLSRSAREVETKAGTLREGE